MSVEDNSTELAGKLERLTEAAIDKLSAVLAEPIDVDNAALLRAQTTSAAVALNAQLRADALRLRAVRADTALAALMVLIDAKRGVVPCDVTDDQSAEGRVLGASSELANAAITAA